MSISVLVIGKDLGVASLENVLTGANGQNYSCVEDIASANWLIETGFNCQIMIIDRAVFGDHKALNNWVAENPQAEIIVTDPLDVRSTAFSRRLMQSIERATPPTSINLLPKKAPRSSLPALYVPPARNQAPAVENRR